MLAESATTVQIALAHRLGRGPAARQLELARRLDAGAFVALFGRSGAGKTTLLRILAGLTRPQHGRIVVAGQVWLDTAAGIDLPPQARSVGMVFQDYALFPNLTVRANVAYATGPNDAAWVDELLEMMHLGALQRQLPATLSGGEQQRVALARAVARRPALLLLDEPLAALDMALRLRLQDDLAALHRRLGLTTLMVSHDIGEVFRMAEEVWQLEDGGVLRAGTPAQVFLSQQVAGKLNLRAQVLALRREDVVFIVTVLVGQEIVDVIAADADAARLRPGDMVTLSAKTFGALRFDAVQAGL